MVAEIDGDLAVASFTCVNKISPAAIAPTQLDAFLISCPRNGHSMTDLE